MAAMAPALTDAPGEAHHIRFKVAPPSSTLSPGSVENNSNASNILISSNGTTKHKAIVSTTTAEDLGFCSSPKKEEQQQRSKLPALVTSFLCSDVPAVGSTKDPVKLQGVFFKQTSLKSRTRLNPTIFNNSNIKAELLAARQHQTLEFSGDNRKTMSGSGQTPMNGLSKKVTKSAVDSDSGGAVIFATANGGKTMPVVSSDQEQLRIPEGIFKDGITSCTIVKGEALEELPVGNLRNLEVSESFTAVNPLSPCTDTADSRTGENGVLNPGFSLGSESEGWSTSRQINPLSSPSLSPFSTLDAEIRARTLQNQSRQNEIESRVRRLRKRLQVVQAKQVERHVQQQLGGFLQTSFSKLPSLDSLRQRSPAVLTRKAEAALRRVATENSTSDGLGQFLKSGTVPTDLERLFLSGTANLRATERAFDSDVTDSSSGGETDIEEEELTKVDIEQRHFPLWKRAEGRFAMERASIVSYWNWLQAHISDLEYRIRQQTDIYRQIRANKGLLLLGDVTSDSPAEDVVNVNLEASGCRQIALDNQMLEVESASPNPVPLKAYVSSKPVNGVVNSFYPSFTSTGSPDSSDTEDTFTKKQRLNLTSTSLDSTCVAARTRPIVSCKKRRLVRPSSVINLNRKVQRASVPRCSCDINPSCVMCGNRASQFTAESSYDAPIMERLSQFDPCLHPILSFPDDVSLNLHFQGVLKSHWQNKPLEKIKPPKKLSLKHKISLSSKTPDTASKEKHKLGNSLLAAVRLSHHKLRTEKIHRQHIDDLLSASKLERASVCKAVERPTVLTPSSCDKSHKRRPRDHSLERTEVAPRHFVDTESPCSSLASLQTRAHSPLMRQLSTSSENSTPVAANSQSTSSTLPVRRRRGESSFDINNIVIPMSVAATTRVEKLQYKEILTPSWREVDICSQPIAEEDDAAEVEDLSDAMFAAMHLKCEDLERSRWTWTASAPAQRRGSRSYKSLDGRTTPLLGGTNPSTPQPSSPDTGHFHTLQDFVPMPSPCSPASPDLISNPYTPGSRDSHRPQSSEDTRCSTPDLSFEELTVQPWERRNFPLLDDPVIDCGDHSELQDRPPRNIRRVSGSKPVNKETENETAPLITEDTKQRLQTAMRAAHR
ncbi:KAT8 regulatory NSL complex subunit 1 [Erpetoichthys calabaricus]|uniref:KAT8 regulatory NSL complex subunit 1 n=1 Tax=Erpetoichthys calabaricus TaxID=27687 RepID=A0A8C4TB77_ERPCA|nr:KAT8 regulatory NSL complex subunit 1 [Erpetoichthys calabaricus]XP_028675657.1 KAT8 regulatory NSL complex subunit 1 [Erpetoichthys calabaricus]XP_028675658.1 KAT8 regulatory NSL complex subunit 1 [Erpetoichthys calabaricus]XP_028675659.1 KAT8 regulatory NSL complex subunit 1 [Erpetoichthys calabaricus]